MKAILFVSKDQFGYHIDSYEYVKKLSESFEVTYLCLNHNLKKVYSEKVNVIYVENNQSRIKKFLNLVKKVYSQNMKEIDVIFCIYFRFCFLLKFLGVPIILDIRTSSVSNNKIKRLLSNLELRINTLFFENITIISDGVAKLLKIKKYDILPLGASKVTNQDKVFNTEEKLKLLYVGTLSNRNIHETIEGTYLFLKLHPDVGIEYRIIGSGTPSEEMKIKEVIERFKLNTTVKLLGRIQHDELSVHFEEAEIGVSYIPITSYYDYQPPTKTFEYIMNGLYCVATKTEANKEIIVEHNGTLIEDTPTGFSTGLEAAYKKIQHLNSDEIVESVIEHSWQNIVEKKLIPIINKIIRK